VERIAGDRRFAGALEARDAAIERGDEFAQIFDERVRDV
jgi:hypothetical protein